ncbi:MAG: WYL domain-containing protein [Lachnospiraceae bacterium]|nr:WYL domain-containing protein [Lachnospiraceae bacterium]
MPHRKTKGFNQKLKLLYLARILFEQTDDNHALSMPEIIDMLSRYEVTADRRTLYRDLDELRHFGLDIIKTKEKGSCFYHTGNRLFELPELKLLVDSVQSAKFITNKKSDELIKKLEALVSIHEARQLQRQVTISGRVKTMNKSIYYNVDRLHEAISINRQITFRYFQWNHRKEMVLRHNGALYQVSPWALVCDNGYYYLIGYDSEMQKIKHYRIDKMLRITVVGYLREGKDQFQEFDLGRYTNCHFGMFGGEITNVTLEADNSMAAIIIDRFGTDIMIIPVDDKHFRTNVNVAISRQFFGWIMSLGDGVKVVGPDRVVKQLKHEIRRLNRQYITINKQEIHCCT